MHCKRLILGGLLAASVAVASAAPAFATQTRVIQPTATQIRTVDGESHILVDGNGTVPGTPVKGRNATLKVYVPRNVRFRYAADVVLLDWQTTTFNLPASNQRFLQYSRVRLIPGREAQTSLELHCKTPGCRGYSHQLDAIVVPHGQPITEVPYTWLGGFRHYTGKQLLTSAFVKVRCKKSTHPHRHHESRKPKCDSRCKG